MYSKKVKNRTLMITMQNRNHWVNSNVSYSKTIFREKLFYLVSFFKVCFKTPLYNLISNLLELGKPNLKAH